MARTREFRGNCGTILRGLMIGAAASVLAGRGAAAPVLTPVPGAKDVCVDTPLRITLEAPPVARTGRIEVMEVGSGAVVASVDVAQADRVQAIGGLANYNVHPLLVTGNEVEIHLPPGVLEYGKTYAVRADESAIKGAGWAAIGGTAWQFSTKAAPPAVDAPRVVVAADGTGDFATIQGAIDFVPVGNKAPRVIFIRAGTYQEILCVLNRDGLTFLGEDRKKTIIAYANN